MPVGPGPVGQERRERQRRAEGHGHHASMSSHPPRPIQSRPNQQPQRPRRRGPPCRPRRKQRGEKGECHRGRPKALVPRAQAREARHRADRREQKAEGLSRRHELARRALAGWRGWARPRQFGCRQQARGHQPRSLLAPLRVSCRCCPHERRHREQTRVLRKSKGDEHDGSYPGPPSRSHRDEQGAAAGDQRRAEGLGRDSRRFLPDAARQQERRGHGERGRHLGAA